MMDNELTRMVNYGKKIAEVDEGNQIVKFIEGVCLTTSGHEILYSSIQVTPEQIKDLQESYRYSYALFKPTKCGVILIDVADYSIGDNLYQAAILNILNSAIQNSIRKIKIPPNGKPLFRQIISTGDGYYIIFHEQINEKFFGAAITFISEFFKVQEMLFKKHEINADVNKMLHIRIACTLNDVDFFSNVIGGNNCFGTGLNEASRILSCGRKKVKDDFDDDAFDTIFFDETLLEQATIYINKLNTSPFLSHIQLIELGTQKDKHGKERDIWWVKKIPLFFSFNPIEVYDIQF
ncbi:MAG: hypothetical protein ABI921_02965 [Panacibacter sp.]